MSFSAPRVDSRMPGDRSMHESSIEQPVCVPQRVAGNCSPDGFLGVYVFVCVLVCVGGHTHTHTLFHTVAWKAVPSARKTENPVFIGDFQ